MSNNQNIKYIFIGNIKTGKKILENFSSNQAIAQKDALQIFDRFTKLDQVNYEDRSKVVNKNGNYFFTTFNPSLFYLVLCDMNYSESLAFQLITEINDSSIPTNLDENGEVNRQGLQDLKSLVEEYETKTTLLSEVSKDVNDIKIELRKDINKVINNNSNVDDLQKQSSSISEGSKMFKGNAEKIKKITCWKNWKLTIIIILLIIGLLLVIILPIVLSSNKSSNQSETAASTLRFLFYKD